MKPRIWIVCLFTLYLQGCTGMAVTGAGLAYDHYRVERGINDRYIAVQIESAIYSLPETYENSNISIATFDSMVLLSGQAKTKEQRAQIIQIAKTVPNIKRLYNFITIGEPTSIATDINDAWITTKVKSSIISKRTLDASNIKVVTVDNVVYLLGKLERDQADLTIDLARQTNGVKQVVTMFEYIHTTLSPIQRTV